MLLLSDSMASAQPRFRLHSKHKPELLFAVMRTLAHEEARISFEGRLSHTELAKIAGTSLNETEVLKRNTTSPRMDFLVLPLTLETVPEIEKAIVSKVACKWPDYDSWHPQQLSCCSCQTAWQALNLDSGCTANTSQSCCSR